MTGGVRVRAAGELAGLEQAIAHLLSAAAEDPRKARTLRRMHGTALLVATDVGASARLTFERGDVTVGATAKQPDVTAEASAHWLLLMPSVPRVLGLTNPFRAEGRLFMRAVLKRQVRIRGYRHPQLLRQLAAAL